MSRALEMFIVEGIYTTIPLHRKILADEDFRAGKIDTGFIERFLKKTVTRSGGAHSSAVESWKERPSAFLVNLLCGLYMTRKVLKITPDECVRGYVIRGMIVLPRLYAIVDSSARESTQELLAFAEELAAGECHSAAIPQQERQRAHNAGAGARNTSVLPPT